MAEEYLDVYDDELNYIGVVSRSEAHRKGYWHYTFHCWVVLETQNGYQVLFQKRHPSKDVNPNKLSVSAAGHILASETVADGVREVKEEIGISVSFQDLHSLGEYRLLMQEGEMDNREISLLYYTVQPLPFSLFSPQLSEVSGLFLVSLQDFYDLMHDTKEEVPASGYEISEEGAKLYQHTVITKDSFSLRGIPYFQYIASSLYEHLF